MLEEEPPLFFFLPPLEEVEVLFQSSFLLFSGLLIIFKLIYEQIFSVYLVYMRFCFLRSYACLLSSSPILDHLLESNNCKKMSDSSSELLQSEYKSNTIDAQWVDLLLPRPFEY